MSNKCDTINIMKNNMLKWKSNSNRIGGGVHTSKISHGIRLWLPIILSFLCAALLCCAFLLSSNSAGAAVKPDDADAGTNVRYSVTNDSDGNPILKLYRNPTNSNTATSFPYGILDDVATVNAAHPQLTAGVGDAAFDADTKTATVIKNSNQTETSPTTGKFHQAAAYTAFKAEVTVPAMTEYKIDFSYHIQMIRYVNNGSSTNVVGINFLYFGNTAEDPNAKDHSDEMTFSYSADPSPDQYAYGRYAKGSAVKSGTTYTITPSTSGMKAIPTVTMTNATDKAKTYTAYFGFFGYSSAGSSYTVWFTSTATMSETITVTPINAPAADKTSADYDANGTLFNFTYDQDRAEVKSVIHEDADGTETDVTGNCAIDSDGNCTLYDVGVYTFTFKIKDDCGAVWNSSTNDQSDKTVKITINAQSVTVPTIATTVQTYDPVNGNPFHITDYDGTKMDISGATPVNHVVNITAAGEYTLTFSLKDKTNTVWSSGGTADKTIKIKVNALQVTAPTINDSTVTYDTRGSKFAVSNFDGNVMTPTAETDGISWNGTLFTATDAGEYTVKFALNDKTNYVWSTGGTDDIGIKVKINPKEVQVNWTSQNTNISDEDPGLFILLPTLDVSAEVKALLTDVKYYLASDCTVSGTTVTPVGSPVTKIEEGNEYYAIVQVNTDVAKSNYSFKGSLFQNFDTNDGRTVVVVTLVSNEVTYNGQIQGAQANVVKADGTPVTDITISLQYTYKDSEGNDLLGAPTDAGEYKVVVSLGNASGQYKASDSLEFTYTIKPAKPVTNPTGTYSGVLYAGGTLRDKVTITPGAGDTAGTYVWDDPDQEIVTGERSYGYTFTPSSSNYETVQGMITLNAAEAGIKSISAQFNFPETNEDGSEFIIYDSWKPDDLRKWLTVTGTKDDGSTQENLPGCVIVETILTKGENVRLTISYGEVTCTVTVPKVEECKLAEIDAHCTPLKTVYTSTNINTLRQWLMVTGKNNDGTAYSGVINGSDCTLSFGEDNKLTAGTITVTATYQGISTTFTVNVEEVKLAGISASWRADKLLEIDEITAKTTEEELKELITVTGKNNDESDYGEITEYTLEIALDDTELTLYISFNGFNAELATHVKEEEAPSLKTKLPVPDFNKSPAYTGSDIDILSVTGWKYAQYVDISGDKTGKFADDYSITLTIKDEYLDSFEWADAAGTSITLNWKIGKAELKVKWNSRGTLDPDGGNYDGSIDGLFKYTYTDEDGNEVTELEDGKAYKVTAELVDENNFVMSDEMSFDITAPHDFTAKSAETDDGGFMKVLKDNLPIFIGVALGLLLLLALILFLVLRRRRADDYDDDYYDDEYDYDDEDDEDDEDYDDEDYDDEDY